MSPRMVGHVGNTRTLRTGVSRLETGHWSDQPTVVCVHIPCVHQIMRQIRFEWDPGKAKSNAQKHGVSFEEAKSVFFDEQALLFEDSQPLHEEERFVRPA